MNEILITLATLANIGSFIFQLLEYKQGRRMVEEKREAE